MLDDEEIVELFCARSEQAIQELDQKYGKLCNSLAHNIVGDRRDAEECVNDAYLGIWNAIPPARPDPLRAYLVKVVRNLSLKAYWKREAAKRNSHYTVALEELEECVPGRETVEDKMDAKELARMIEGFLETLTAENRAIFLRRYWFCDSCRDIAVRLGLTEKTVSVRLARIRGKLKRYLIEREVLI